MKDRDDGNSLTERILGFMDEEADRVLFTRNTLNPEDRSPGCRDVQEVPELTNPFALSGGPPDMIVQGRKSMLHLVEDDYSTVSDEDFAGHPKDYTEVTDHIYWENRSQTSG